MPPLAFTSDELQALALGARLVSAWGDQDMAHAVNEVTAKVNAVVAEGQRAEL
jgi:predicted DNA-binding transcriptional regulator YafY